MTTRAEPVHLSHNLAHRTKNARLATLLVIAAALLWGTMGIFVRSMSGFQLSAMDIVAARVVVTVPLLLAYIVLRGRGLLRIRVRDTWCFVGTGLCSIVFFNYCYFTTIMLTSLSTAAVLLYTAPTIVMVLSVLLFREKPAPRKVFALALAFLGCILATRTGSGPAVPLTAQGILTGLGAGLGYALYSIFGRYALQRGYHPLAITLYTFVIASIGVAPLTHLGRLASSAAAQPRLLVWGAVMALVTTVLPYVLYTTGLQHIEPSRAAIVASVEPVAATLIGAWLYGELLTLPGALGVALVVLSIAVLSVKGAADAGRGGAGDPILPGVVRPGTRADRR